MTIAYDEAQRWPIEHARDLMPGDETMVPYPSYPVRMDTVRAVEARDGAEDAPGADDEIVGIHWVQWDCQEPEKGGCL